MSEDTHRHKHLLAALEPIEPDEEIPEKLRFVRMYEAPFPGDILEFHAEDDRPIRLRVVRRTYLFPSPTDPPFVPPADIRLHVRID